MAGVVDTTHTFANNEVITSTLMNNIIDETLFTSDALANSTLSLTAGKMKVATSGITSNELAVNSVTTNAILDGSITDAKINSSAAISLSKLANGALPTGVTIDSANLVSSSVTTAKIANGNITAEKLSGAQTGTAPVFGVRAWANFNSLSNTDVAGTFSRSGTTVTVTVTGHGLIAGNLIFIDFTAGTGTVAPDGLYVVASVTDANVFTVTSAASATGTGTVALRRKTIRASGNISCISAARENPVIPPTTSVAPEDGFYVANFLIPMPDTNFGVFGSVSTSLGFAVTDGNDILSGSSYNAQSARIITLRASNEFPTSNAVNIISVVG
jgi:hypothetical protein